MDGDTKRGRVDLALVHHPVVNKNGEVIGSAVTNLDLHDIARAARTFGAGRFYVVSPYEDQRQLTREILDHWLQGHGSVYNAKRGEALSVVSVCDDLAGLYEQITARHGERPLVIATSARAKDSEWSFSRLRRHIGAGGSVLILLGTAWGLAPEVMDTVDGVLPPIMGDGEYNHLSVRSAASIILDRLLGRREEG